MKKITLIFALLFTFFCNGQNHIEKDVEAIIKTFFEGFHKGDTTLMRSVMMPKVTMQTAYINGKGEGVFVDDGGPDKLLVIGSKRPVVEKWEERISSYTVKVDGNMANAWTEYEFWLDGKFSHCGVNSFQLFHDNGTWKIIYLIDTRRKSSCGAFKE